MLTVKTFVVNMIEENCYVVSDETGEALIIDCGALRSEEQNEIRDYIARHELVPKHLLCTHGHFDHVFGNSFIRETYGLLPEMHRSDWELYSGVTDQVRLILHKEGAYDCPPIGGELTDGQIIRWGRHQLEVIATPGHTQGGVCFYCAAEHLLFSGDSLFLHSVGRTDLPGGSGVQLLQSLATRIMKLPADTLVYPGHGPRTTIGGEARHNPYLS